MRMQNERVTAAFRSSVERGEIVLNPSRDSYRSMPEAEDPFYSGPLSVGSQAMRGAAELHFTEPTAFEDADAGAEDVIA